MACTLSCAAPVVGGTCCWRVASDLPCPGTTATPAAGGSLTTCDPCLSRSFILPTHLRYVRLTRATPSAATAPRLGGTGAASHVPRGACSGKRPHLEAHSKDVPDQCRACLVRTALVPAVCCLPKRSHAHSRACVGCPLLAQELPQRGVSADASVPGTRATPSGGAVATAAMVRPPLRHMWLRR